MIKPHRLASVAAALFAPACALAQAVTWAEPFEGSGPYISAISASGRYWTGSQGGVVMRGDFRLGTRAPLPCPPPSAFVRSTTGLLISADGETVIARTHDGYFNSRFPGWYLAYSIRRGVRSADFAGSFWEPLRLSEDGGRACGVYNNRPYAPYRTQIYDGVALTDAAAPLRGEERYVLGATADLSRFVLRDIVSTGYRALMYDASTDVLTDFANMGAGNSAAALAVSPEGTCVVGAAVRATNVGLWKWTQGGGFEELGHIRARWGLQNIRAFVGADGRFAIFTFPASNGATTPWDAYIFDGENLLPLADLLQQRGAPLPSNRSDLFIGGVSSDGSVIVASYHLQTPPNQSRRIIIRDLFPAAPDVELSDDGQTSARGLGRTCSVRYLTETGLDLTSLGGGDVEARTPSGQRVLMTITGTPRTVEGGTEMDYTFDARGGAAQTNGPWEYQIWLRPNEVRDLAGVVAPMRFVGHISGHSGEPRTVFEEWSAEEGALRTIVRHVDVAGSPLGISWTSAGDGDLQLTGPNGYSRLSKVVRREIAAPGELLAAYQFPPRGLYWNWTDNGTYTLSMRAGEVWDEQGHLVEPGTLAGTAINFQTPFAAVASVTARAGYSDMRVTMNYRANGRFMSWGSFGADDLELRGANGFVSRASLVSRQYSSLNNSYTVVYSIPARGGSWDPSDNGAYSLWTRSGEVWDALGYAVPAVQIGGYGLSF